MLSTGESVGNETDISILGHLDLAGDRQLMGDSDCYVSGPHVPPHSFLPGGGMDGKEALRQKTRDPGWECF